jgi:hypothetical protein
LIGSFTISQGAKPYADGGMPKVNPAADMPRADLVRFFQLF